MRRSLLILFILTGVFTDTIQAQERCDLNRQVDILLTIYTQTRAEDMVGAAQKLQRNLTDLLAECENPFGTLRAEDLQPGQWHITWGGDSTLICATAQIYIPFPKPLFLLQVDGIGDRFTVIDRYAWSAIMLTSDRNGGYGFSGWKLLENYVQMNYEYQVTITSPEQIDGLFTAHIPVHDCYLRGNFQMTLVDANITCIVNTLDGDINLREGPGIEFARAGAMRLTELYTIIGQRQGSDGLTWWKLTNDTWVRSDLVEEAGDCESIPVVAAQ